MSFRHFSAKALICLKGMKGADLNRLMNIGLCEKREQFYIKKKILHDKVINLLFEDNCIINQIAAQTASKKLGAICNVVNCSSIFTEIETSYYNLSKLLQAQSDLILTATKFHKKLEDIVDLPILNVLSCYQRPAMGITTSLTLLEYYGRTQGLTVSLIGNPYPYFNSLILVLPKLGIDMKILTSFEKDSQLSPRYLLNAEENAKENNTLFEESSDLSSVLCNTDVVIVGADLWKNFRINEKDMNKLCKPEWTFIYDPIRRQQIDTDLLCHPNMLTYKMIENLKWIYVAVILDILYLDKYEK